MKSILKAFSAVALSGVVVLPALAGTDTKDLKKVIEDQGINYVETAQKGITLSGYVDTSYTQQFAGAGQYAPAGPFATNPGGGPANTQGTITNGANGGSSIHQFDTSNGTFNVNAVKLALEKALPDKNEWAAGFRIDTIYGSDAKYLRDTAFNGGANTSGLALEQALVKFRIPVGNGLDIYMGKFVTFLGYEVIESPANLNFSRGLLFTNAIPLTHTGIYGDYKFNDTVEVKLGIVDGWNNSTVGSVGAASGINDDGGFGKAITGQINVTAPGKNANIANSFIYSPNGEPGAIGVDNGPVVVYDIWGNWNPTFVKDSALTLGFNVDLGYNGASGYPGAPATAAGVPVGGVGAPFAANGAVSDSNTWYGVAAYASYKVTKVVTLSARGEYLHEDASWNPKFGAEGVNNDDFSETLTASFNIWDNLLTRIEYRFDSYTNGTITTATGAPIKGSFATANEVSLNAVYSF